MLLAGKPGWMEPRSAASPGSVGTLHSLMTALGEAPHQPCLSADKDCAGRLAGMTSRPPRPQRAGAPFSVGPRPSPHSTVALSRSDPGPLDTDTRPFPTGPSSTSRPLLWEVLDVAGELWRPCLKAGCGRGGAPSWLSPLGRFVCGLGSRSPRSPSAWPGPQHPHAKDRGGKEDRRRGETKGSPRGSLVCQAAGNRGWGGLWWGPHQL